MALGKKFKSVKSGEIFTVVEVNDKFGQIIVEDKEGKTKAYSSSTIKDKRRFVPVEDEDDFEAVDHAVVNSIKENNLASDREAEEAVDGKKKSAKKSETAPITGIGVRIKDFILNEAYSIGADVCVATTGKFISFKINGKMFAAIFSYSKKSATLGIRSKAIEGSNIVCSKKMNHMMDCRFTFSDLSEENKTLIDTLLVSSKEYQLNK